jgi:hypothetical protein
MTQWNRSSPLVLGHNANVLLNTYMQQQSSHFQCKTCPCNYKTCCHNHNFGFDISQRHSVPHQQKICLNKLPVLRHWQWNVTHKIGVILFGKRYLLLTLVLVPLISVLVTGGLPRLSNTTDHTLRRKQGSQDVADNFWDAVPRSIFIYLLFYFI